MTLREKAQYWLDNYKGAGNAYGGNTLSLEEMTTIVAEYLHGCKDGDSYKEKYDKCRAELEKALERNAELEDSLATKSKQVNAYIAELRGKVAAYEFAIRCNGVSGAEVIKE